MLYVQNLYATPLETISPHKITIHINTIQDKTSPKMNHILKKNVPEDENNCKYTVSLKMILIVFKQIGYAKQIISSLNK